jgi:hypothetical protein
MEYTEEDDDFNSWMDVVKENYPAIEITDEVLKDYSNSWVKPNVYKDFEKSDVDKL